MPDEDPPAARSPVAQPPGGPEAAGSATDRPRSVEILQRAGTEPKPLNPNAEHQRRFNEALVRQQETKADQAGDDRALRKRFAIWIAAAVGVQIVAADVVFVVYGAANAWGIPGSTISAWLGATVVQVIAVAVVIVRSLFPPPAQSG